MAINNISREDFLSIGGKALLTLSGLNILSSGFPNLAMAVSQEPSNTLITIFLRGGCDGLNFVTPISGDDRKIYEEERPNLHMELSGADALLPLDNKFGIHPKASKWHKLFLEKKLAIVHATGLSTNTRSHFDAQNYIELGTPDKKTTPSGWLTRFLRLQTSSKGSLPAIASSALLPTSFLDYENAVSITDLKRLNLAGFNKIRDKQQEILSKLYENGTSFLHLGGKQALDSLQILQNATSNAKAAITEYPKSDISNKLHTLADLMKLGCGIRAATIDMGGWDTHKYQGVGNDGAFAKQVEALTEGVATFWHDLESNAPEISNKTIIIVITEFGRRLRENASRGTDHGHGSIFFAMGNGIHGGKIYGKWPGLATEKLYERADLAVTTDFRTPISEILQKKFQVKDIAKVFPDFQHKDHLGLCAN